MKILSLRKAERGVAHVFMVVLALLLVGGIGGLAVWRISGYTNKSGDNANGKTASDGSNSATVSDDCVAQTHDANICHFGAIQSLDKYASTVKVVMQADDGTRTITEKFDGKGNSTVESDGINGITVGGHTYAQLGGTWIDYGTDSAAAPSTTSAPSLATTAGIKYENLGKEACGKDTCYKYRCTGGVLGTSTVLVTFGTKDYLPRHYGISTPSGSTGLLGNMTMDITYGPVTITAPAGALTIEQYQQRLIGG